MSAIHNAKFLVSLRRESEVVFMMTMGGDIREKF